MQTTPLQIKYAKLKELNPGKIVAIKLGDFYEIFGEDAKLASKVMNIALTKRGVAPMCGFPYHAVDKYTKILQEAGFSVFLTELTRPITYMPRKAEL